MGAYAYTQPRLFLDGYEVAGQFQSLTLNLGSEMLDATTFQQDTKINAGGLKTVSVTGNGLINLSTAGIETLLAANLDVTSPMPASFWPNNVSTCGSTGAGSGYGLQSVEGTYTIGGQVGVLAPFTVDIQNAGQYGAHKVVCLWNAMTSAWSSDSTGGTGWPVSTAGWSTGQMLFAGYHITALSTSKTTTATILVQAASSSGTATASRTTLVTFSAVTCKTGSYATPITTMSTERPYLSAKVTLSTGTSTGASANGIVWAGIE